MSVVFERQASRDIEDMFPELAGKFELEGNSDEKKQRRKETRFCKLLRVGTRMLQSGGCGEPTEL